MSFCGARVIFPFLNNGQFKISVSVNTQTTGILNLGGGGSVIGSFVLGHIFGELEPFSSFS